MESKVCLQARHLKLRTPVPAEMRLPWVIRFSGQSTKVYLILNVANLAHQMHCSFTPNNSVQPDFVREGERVLCVPTPGARDTALPYSLLGGPAARDRAVPGRGLEGRADNPGR